MQFPGDSELADYLSRPHCVIQHELKVDWDNNGNFANPYSDLSTVFEEITIERSFRGDIPDELLVVEGFSVAEMSITLAGKLVGDSTDLYALTNPWNKNSSLYQKSNPGVAITYRMIVSLPGNPRVIDQFVGIVRSIDPELEDGLIKIMALDLMDLLNRAVTLRPIAVDYTYMLFTALTAEQQKFNLTWALDQILRECGLFQSPAAVATTNSVIGYICCTLNGSFFPESISSPNYNAIDSVISAPDPVYVPGKYGYAANGTMGGYTQYKHTVDPRGTWNKGETQQMGGWVKGPQDVNGGTDTCICDVTLSGNAGAAGQCRMQLFLSTAGVVRAVLQQLTGQAYNVTFTGPTIPVVTPSIWHYIAVGLEWRLSDSGITATFNVDGSITTASSATVLLAFTPQQSYSQVIIQAKMPTQSVQWWKTISGALTWPKDPPTSTFGVNPQTSLDLALSYLTAIPDIWLDKGTAVVTNMMKAELGVMFSRENGQIVFLNRSSVSTARSQVNSFTLREVDLTTMSIHNRVDSYVNFLTAESSLIILLLTTIFSSDRAERFDTPATSIKRFLLPMENVHRIASAAPPFTNPWVSTVTTGFHVTRISDGTIPPGVTVAVTVIDQHTMAVDVINTSTDNVRLATAAGEPALRIAAYSLYTLSETSQVLYNAGSGGGQILPLSRNDWRTHAGSVATIGNSLLAGVSRPIPIIDPVEVRCDPRLQLNDLVYIDTLNSGRIVTAVTGYTRLVRQNEFPTDKLILRALHTPGYWLLGEPGYSELNSTTKLA